MDNLIQEIKICIERAIRHESKLSPEALMVPSLTSLKIRHLYNNLGGIAKNFCEVGSHRGGSFCSFVYENTNLKLATAIDNFSENFHDGDVEADFIENAYKFTPVGVAWELVDKDCFSIDEDSLPNKVDLYLFDGNHSEESQCKALTYYTQFLTDTFIFCCDDYSWDAVKQGTQRGIKEAGLEVLFEQEFHTPEGGAPNDHWHNGTYVALLKQTK